MQTIRNAAPYVLILMAFCLIMYLALIIPSDSGDFNLLTGREYFKVSGTHYGTSYSGIDTHTNDETVSWSYLVDFTPVAASDFSTRAGYRESYLAIVEVEKDGHRSYASYTIDEIPLFDFGPFLKDKGYNLIGIQYILVTQTDTSGSTYIIHNPIEEDVREGLDRWNRYLDSSNSPVKYESIP